MLGNKYVFFHCEEAAASTSAFDVGYLLVEQLQKLLGLVPLLLTDGAALGPQVIP